VHKKMSAHVTAFCQSKIQTYSTKRRR